jgi:hypothetical protein
MRAHLLVIAYRLHQHCLGEWRLDRWVISLALACALLFAPWSLLGGGGRAQTVAGWRALALGLALLGAAGTWLCGRWAACRNYMIFAGQPAAAPPGHPLAPADKVPLQASGWFEVAGKRQFFASLPAFWRTFATREHAVMGLVRPGRFIVIGQVPDSDVGLWYIFFRPESLLELAPGRLAFDAESRLALRVTYQALTSGAPGPAERRRSARAATVYLSFDDESSLRRVWADLLADGDISNQ